MKRIALSLALAATAATASWALVADGDEKHESAASTTMELDQAPAPVQAAIKKAAGSVSVAEVEKEDNDGVTIYESGWKVGDVQHEVMVNETGHVLAKEKSVSGDQVPEPVRKAAAMHLPQGATAEFESKTVMLYEIIATVNGKEVEMLVDPSGRRVQLEADEEHEDHDGDGDDDDDDGNSKDDDKD